MLRDQRSSTAEEFDIDLRHPAWAAFWAWLWPGAGHFYQRRHAKGTLFMLSILATYFFGLTLGSGHVVYAAWTKNDRRWQYFCQLGVGAPALPALLQSHRVKQGREPLFGGIMAPPRFVAESDNSIDLQHDELHLWHLNLNVYFELGTLYTMIAGLLNVLAIYDAYGGPVTTVVHEQSDRPPPQGKVKKPA